MAGNLARYYGIDTKVEVIGVEGGLAVGWCQYRIKLTFA
jgi:hypothetical protein